jgi:hypothetical protein
VARARLPVVFQMAERSSRPPSRGQVEGGQQQVGPGEIRERSGQRSGQKVAAQAGNDPEQPGQEAAGERPDQRDQELVARAAGLHPGSGGPAEQEQGDVLDPDPPGLGDQGVGQLVDQDRPEEQHRRQDGQRDRAAA